MSGQHPVESGVPPNMGEEIDERNAQLELNGEPGGRPQRAPEFEEELSDASGRDGGEELKGGQLSPLVYRSVEGFVTEYLLPLYRRAVSGSGTTWCAEWWRHQEACVRLAAMWRSWEYLRQDPATGMSVWLRDHADPHMSVLLSADGPFKGCTEKEHSRRALAPLPSAPVPDGIGVELAAGRVVRTDGEQG